MKRDLLKRKKGKKTKNPGSEKVDEAIGYRQKFVFCHGAVSEWLRRRIGSRSKSIRAIGWILWGNPRRFESCWHRIFCARTNFIFHPKDGSTIRRLDGSTARILSFYEIKSSTNSKNATSLILPAKVLFRKSSSSTRILT